MDARYKHADELPPMDTDVILTMPDGREFLGRRIFVEDGERGCWAWATTNEYEPKAPRCWTDGVCWGSNDDGVPSRQPRHWRFKT